MPNNANKPAQHSRILQCTMQGCAATLRSTTKQDSRCIAVKQIDFTVKNAEDPIACLTKCGHFYLVFADPIIVGQVIIPCVLFLAIMRRDWYAVSSWKHNLQTVELEFCSAVKIMWSVVGIAGSLAIKLV